MQLWRVEAPAPAATPAKALAFASLAWVAPEAFASRKGRRLRRQNNSNQLRKQILFRWALLEDRLLQRFKDKAHRSHAAGR